MIFISDVDLNKRLADLWDLIQLQSSPGNWDYDQYTHGLLNGMLLAHAVILDQPVKFNEAPDTWVATDIENRKRNLLHTTNPTLKLAWDHYQLILSLTQEPPKKTS